MSSKYVDETTFEILYQNLCMGVSQEELARRYSHDNRYDTQRKISKCVIDHGFHTGVPDYQTRLARNHLLGLSREEFRRYIAGYQGSSQTKLEDFYAYIDNLNKRGSLGQRTPSNRDPVQQNSQQQQLAGWRSPEEIAEERAREEHEAKMEAAGYVKVGDIFTGYKWITHKEIQEQAIVSLATEKGRLIEYVIEQVNAGNFIFDVVLLGHITPGAEPEHTFSHITTGVKKCKYLPFLPDKIVTDVVEYPSFHLSQTPTYGEDITNVNATYLIPRGYRISKITILEKISRQSSNLPDILIVRLTCEDFRHENNAHEKSRQAP